MLFDTDNVYYKDLIKTFDIQNPLTSEYFNICSRNTEESKYFDRHHILPKSIFPKYAKSEWNLVKLSYKDHYRVHEILPFICTNKQHSLKMANAWAFFKKDNVDINLYDELKRKHKEFLINREFTEEHRLNLSKTGKGRIVTEETKIKLRTAQINLMRKLDDEHKLKLLKANKGRKQTEDHVAKRVGHRKGKPLQESVRYKRKIKGYKSGIIYTYKGYSFNLTTWAKVFKVSYGKLLYRREKNPSAEYILGQYFTEEHKTILDMFEKEYRDIHL